jgi:hypothetical protein
MPKEYIFYETYEFLARRTSNCEFRSKILPRCYYIIYWYRSVLFLAYYKSFLVLNNSEAFNLKVYIYFLDN